VEQGTHTQLLEAQGAYARMWSMQQSQEEQAP
jgi:ABC-type multidrug transport system fused ATPase/permease subunit